MLCFIISDPLVDSLVPLLATAKKGKGYKRIEVYLSMENWHGGQMKKPKQPPPQFKRSASIPGLTNSRTARGVIERPAEAVLGQAMEFSAAEW